MDKKEDRSSGGVMCKNNSSEGAKETGDLNTYYVADNPDDSEEDNIVNNYYRNFEPQSKSLFANDIYDKLEGIRIQTTYSGAYEGNKHVFDTISFIPKARGFTANDDWSQAEFTVK